MLCISILHSPGEDEYGYESASERWLPIHTVESIVSFISPFLFLCSTRVLPVINYISVIVQLVSVISLLSAYPPPTDSPANVDAAKEVRENLPGTCLFALPTSPFRPTSLSGCYG